MIVNLFVQWEGFIKFSSHSLKGFFSELTHPSLFIMLRDK